MYGAMKAVSKMAVVDAPTQPQSHHRKLLAVKSPMVMRAEKPLDHASCMVQNSRSPMLRAFFSPR